MTGDLEPHSGPDGEGAGGAVALDLAPGRGAGLTAHGRGRAIGCLVGGAVGDALGAPFEFLPGGVYRRRFPVAELEGDGEMVGGGAFDWAPGEFTDDTQMALVIAESLLEHGRYDLGDIWERWRVWARTSSDVGATTATALRAVDPRRSHELDEDLDRTAGNGALMRASPLALATLHVSDTHARGVVLDQAASTHPHPAAGFGAWIAVAAMRAAMVAGPDADAALEDALSAIDREVAAMQVLEPEHAGRFAAMLDAGWEPTDADVGNGSVWGCLAQAVWALRRGPDLEAVVVEAIDLGHDADTVGCVAGALAGAVHGVESVPQRWLAPLNGRVATVSGELTYGLADLQRIALALVGQER